MPAVYKCLIRSLIGVVWFHSEPGLTLLCEIRVHMLSREAEHSEAEPQVLLSTSGHMASCPCVLA